jgi:peptide subunit release factor RF-3
MEPIIDSSTKPVSTAFERSIEVIEEAENFVDEMEKDDGWLKSHLEEIVEKYAHKVIAILDQGVVCVGESITEVQQLLAEPYPQRVPFIFEVPSQEEFEGLRSSIERAYVLP